MYKLALATLTLVLLVGCESNAADTRLRRYLRIDPATPLTESEIRLPRSGSSRSARASSKSGGLSPRRVSDRTNLALIIRPTRMVRRTSSLG